jgi:bisphosphoglycerate-dependent phosphoglycerate mutase
MNATLYLKKVSAYAILTKNRRRRFMLVYIIRHGESETNLRKSWTGWLDAELTEKGTVTTLERVLEEMRERDKNDSTRATAPAIPADDAIILDNSGMNIEETERAALNIIEEKTRLVIRK